MEMNPFRRLYPEVGQANFLCLSNQDKVNFTQRPQDTGKAVPERSTSKKKKTPARARRDRRRWTKRYQKKNSAPKPVESRTLVPEPKQLESSQEVLESPKTKLDNISSCSEIDSYDDVDEPVLESPNFCATCYVGPPAVTFCLYLYLLRSRTNTGIFHSGRESAKFSRVLGELL